MMAFIVPLAIIGSMNPENAPRVFFVGLLFGLIAALPLLLVFLGTRERTEYQQQDAPHFLDSIKAAYHNRPFIFASGVFFFTWAGLELLQGVLLYFLKYHMNREAESETIAGSVFVFALLSLPFWNWLSARWDKRKAYILGMIFLSAVIISLSMVNPSLEMVPILLLAALAGVGIGCMQVLPWSMIPDAIEWDQLKTGQRHEGMFYSLVTLAQKVASSIAIPLVLLMLQFTGYVPVAATQPESAVLGIRLAIGPIPAVLLCSGIVFAVLYPLSRASHRHIVEILEARRDSSKMEPQ
jgi:GPH family glycoside/pentoside/hexuronide:cation symporter